MVAALSTTQVEWMSRLLTMGFLAFEALDQDDECSQICGLCGICPELCLGDGGEDISCALEDCHLETSLVDTRGEHCASYVDTFLDQLKIFMVGGIVYPSTHTRRRFPMDMSTVPPFLLPANRNHTVYNTEMLKDTRFTDAKVLEGNQQLFIQELELGNIKMENLNTLKTKDLVAVLLSIEFLK